jgi:outer membrane beta-barrel protein
MLQNSLTVILAVFLVFFKAQSSIAAEVVEIPQEELARESVLPIFDKSTAVKNRNIVTAKKVDAGLFYGYAMTEAIANVSKLGLSIYYNIDDVHALGLLYTNNSTGTSDYAKQIEQQFNLDFNRAPMPKNIVLADYNFNAFYGKLSLAKSVVFNTMIFGSGSAGLIQYDHKSFPALAIGVGQKFFFNRHFALRLDLRIYANQAPIPFLKDKLKNPLPGGVSAPTYNDFQERLTFTTNLDIGVSYLF